MLYFPFSETTPITASTAGTRSRATWRMAPFPSTTTGSRTRSGRLRVPVHSAHVGQEVEIHYRWHPLYGRRVRVRDCEQRNKGPVVHVEVSPGMITTIAAWMLDPIVCAGMEAGQPRVSAAALRDLHRLLTERKSTPADCHTRLRRMLGSLQRSTVNSFESLFRHGCTVPEPTQAALQRCKGCLNWRKCTAPAPHWMAVALPEASPAIAKTYRLRFPGTLFCISIPSEHRGGAPIIHVTDRISYHVCA